MTQHIGPYKIIKILGKGGMGVVYQALDTRVERVVAIKLLHSNVDTNSVKRFVQEGQLMARLRHPRVLKLYEINRFQDNVYLVMEFVKGKTLTHYIEERSFDHKQTCEIFGQIVNAMQFIHSAGIIHRDLKPDNIMIDAQGHVKIMDFGLARFVNDDKQLSKSGMILGTLHYMPPEQAEGHLEKVDARSDVYALGAILYQMLTYQKVFTASGIVQMVCLICEQQPKPLREINSKIDEDLQFICLKALEKKRENRYQSVGALEDDIGKFINGEAIDTQNVRVTKLLWSRLQQHKRHVLITIVFSAIVISPFIYNSMQESRKNYGEIQNLHTQAQGVLQQISDKEVPTWTMQIEKIPNVEYLLSLYVEAETFLARAYSLDASYDDVNADLFNVQRSICILATLSKNYAVSRFYLQCCKELDYYAARKLEEKITQHENKIRLLHEREIDKILQSLKKEPEPGELDEYIFQGARWKSSYSVRKLLPYISSSISWQRYFAIQVLGSLGDLHTSYKEKNSGQLLQAHLETRKIPQEIDEAKMIIWALGKLRFKDALPSVEKIRQQFSPTSLLRKETQRPYEWLTDKSK
ncbi:serine/threonine protein kinase [Candidatus Uabimicrobium amorphum]|uniref:non-specific serine/threonine protein kinase n=1 Tax=Uabimicrobium amorphum TaxID=2596890 RepID=A0A5S9F250_UABAM|nr:serine/threonine-protein kinase [Candidatus Uabimicrobium amorphum]BBM82089.1 protein kinase [Candidatus Uabimicrobium amorphum]